MATETSRRRWIPLGRTDREILALAIPAFLALVSEPLFLLADASIIGHLGTTELAALGVAGSVITTAIGLCIFLAYGTTASVARKLGAGDLRGALAQGIDGVWLAVLIGTVVTVLGMTFASDLVGLFGAADAITSDAADYLRIAFLGTIPLLVVLATTGVLRGLLDTRTPLIAAAAGNLFNIIFNLALVHGWGPLPALGLVGSAWGTVLAQLLMALGLVAVVVRGARRQGAPLSPDLPGVRAAGRAAVPLLVRTLTLRASLLVTTYAVVQGGDDTSVAAHNLAFALWSFLAFVLDSLAIAAQALTGRALGAGDLDSTRRLTRRMTWWGIWCGVVTGLALALASPVAGHLFTNDAAVVDKLAPALLVAALAQPIAGVVFVLDGVLIGAGDGNYLAWAGGVVFLVYTPFALLATGLVGVWLAFAVAFMGGRCVTLVHRARGTSWMVSG
ncbi:MATE family efflux transporter [Nocardioides alcanivorans]|uniref:MATE family efflux transporter n=1 Tax=Nocardioides alcanivorans TaxID=2897352 RepID=UPI001F34DCEA|nr:MATE family efflux transporter [Nocardioides alcanivorans]